MSALSAYGVLMEVMVVAGFLGSGKTSLVLATIGKVIEITKKRVVVVVNDFGTIGIDGKIMEKYGLQVAELSSGCICCTLGPDLLQTIKEVEEGFKPDMVVIEPTGVADPEAIVMALQHYPGKPISRVRTMVIVDAVRFEPIMKALSRPFHAQLKAADLILINKVDRVDRPAVKEIERRLREINSNTPIIAVSATEGTNIDEVVATMVNQ